LVDPDATTLIAVPSSPPRVRVSVLADQS
jgi:hypothetical protein